MSEQELREWVAANLRYLLATCGTEPWTDANSNEEE